MKTNSFDTFLVLLRDAYEATASDSKSGHVCVVSPHGYNLTINIVTSNGKYSNVANHVTSDDSIFDKFDFIQKLPVEFLENFTEEQLMRTIEYIETRDKNERFRPLKGRGLFLIGKLFFILFMKEESDFPGLH